MICEFPFFIFFLEEVAAAALLSAFDWLAMSAE
jgi:hypothetical protein